MLQQTCFEKRVLRQDGSGYLDIRRVTLTRGGSEGPGAALTSRGEIMLRQVVVFQNLAEEPGGGVFSMRRITAHWSRITGNLANDDGGGLYARRGGVQVYDSILGNNLVDGSGGAIGSTGDILVVRSEIDGNTTDGDGGALYADEDGDVTVIGSHIDGSAADGPGGAIFTLDGDVAVYDSTLIGNRADDRGGAISGEDDVLVVNSTIARNLAVAHPGGGLWARGDMVLINATVANNYAEGEGGGLLSAGAMTLLHSTVVANIAPVGGDLGAGGTFTSHATIIGPPVVDGVTGDTIPTRRSCRVYAAISHGFNFVNDDTCRLDRRDDILGEDPQLRALEDDPRGFVLVPRRNSPVRRALPGRHCVGRTSRLPRPLPAGQLLTGYVSWKDVLSHDALGRPRAGLKRCDIGAAQGGRDHAATPRTEVPPARVAVARAWPYADPAGVDRAVARAAPHRPRSLRGRLVRLERTLSVLQAHARRFTGIESCLTEVGVSRRGDPQHRWGYEYDERDGTGRDLRPALALARRGRPDWRLLDLASSPGCLSRPADPNGTGADARAAAQPAPWGRSSRGSSPRRLLRWLDDLELVARDVEQQTQRFDQWESCLTAVPVTEAGAEWQRLGYLTGRPQRRPHYRAAIDRDTSEWDDPDYQLLAFRGTDRPYGRGDCGADPAESLDRTRPDRPRATTRDDVRKGIASLSEDVEDLREPVSEITQFDECVYTIGVRQSGGYRYQTRNGRGIRAGALSFAIRGPEMAQLQLLVVPGEEPPQIECNEDASGEGTDE
ncbi:hypothetical protein IEZ26_17305 [Nocardioides cavernae]|uniref:Right-handed parallel beta-helix repeat-containing protein n=1 Tax=Nocardioides cavernae TaxID=1921566 RepID=A0ABR8NHI8_9ACTN|nr:hypothetical protein [Nocardioides cavernae]MBD3926384.1 hypothetical protein [Nocardioides cavernae]MBM7512101.1 hypothetical protein [Nocardioides cavernae]